MPRPIGSQLHAQAISQPRMTCTLMSTTDKLLYRNSSKSWFHYFTSLWRRITASSESPQSYRPKISLRRLSVLSAELSRDGCVPYVALSYVWGNPAITHPIQVNGQKYHITTNLESALRHIRGKFQ